MNEFNRPAEVASEYRETIVIVDDNPNNLRVLSGMLQQGGYRVRPALSGELALRSILSNVPDLVLLDIRMAGLDGYEVCRRLKADSTTREIPVIFISALQETADKVGAFNAGGVDYIVKPFQIEEVLARVEIHTELASARKALQHSKAALEEQVEERTKELKHSNQSLKLAIQREQALTQLLSVSLHPLSMETYLDSAVDVLTGNLQSDYPEICCAVFLAEGDEPNRFLRLMAAKSFAPEKIEACGHVPFDAWARGSTDRQGRVVLGDESEACQLLRGSIGGKCSCYSVPLVCGDRTLGVLASYFTGKADPQLKAFLSRAADVFSMGISRREAESRIEYLALHDELTDLANRRLFSNRLDQELERARRRNEFGAVLFLDLDHFKNINDALGHTLGDRFLIETGVRFKRQLRAEDTLCRWGGDEFLVLLPALDRDMEQSVRKADLVAHKLMEQAAVPLEIEDHKLQLTASIGVAMFPDSCSDSEDLIKHADTAMYQAKQVGRNTVRFYEAAMQEAVERRITIDRDLRQALKDGQLELVYQPQVETDGGLLGVESLLRWRHPERGMVSPGEFIPVAEDSGLIVPIGEWVLTKAFQQMREWKQSLPGTSRLRIVSINVSSRQFMQRDFTNLVERLITASGVDPANVELEVTETMLLIDVEDTIRKMNRLKELGVSFAIDDFGTGYSSLSYLKKLPLDRLKIDKSFVRDVHKDPHDAAIVSTIIAMARNLGLAVIAEGVETAEELEFLKKAGCDAFQGYYFSRPIQAEQIAAMVTAGN